MAESWALNSGPARPMGVVVYAETSTRYTLAAGGTYTTPYPAATVNFVAAPGRRYRYSAQMAVNSSVVNDNMASLLYDNGTLTGFDDATALIVGTIYTLRVNKVWIPTPGPHVMTLTFGLAAGTGVPEVRAESFGGPATFMVEDIGGV